MHYYIVNDIAGLSNPIVLGEVLIIQYIFPEEWFSLEDYPTEMLYLLLQRDFYMCLSQILN